MQSEQDKANLDKSLFDDGKNSIAAALEHIREEKRSLEEKPLRNLQNVMNDVDKVQVIR